MYPRASGVNFVGAMKASHQRGGLRQRKSIPRENPKIRTRERLSSELNGYDVHMHVRPRRSTTRFPMLRPMDESERQLHAFARQNNVKGIEMLLEEDLPPQVNCKCKRGLTALFWASDRGNLEAAKKLIEAKADINFCGGRGVSPLMCAASAGHMELVKFLLKHGADLRARDIQGETALDLARSEGRREIQQYLERQEHEISNQKNPKQRSSLARGRKSPQTETTCSSNRVKIACVRCRQKKRRCEERRPCSKCMKDGVPCEEIPPDQIQKRGSKKGKKLVQKDGHAAAKAMKEDFAEMNWDDEKYKLQSYKTLEEDETVEAIAEDFKVSTKSVLSLNRGRYKGLSAKARLRKGTSIFVRGVMRNKKGQWCDARTKEVVLMGQMGPEPPKKGKEEKKISFDSKKNVSEARWLGKWQERCVLLLRRFQKLPLTWLFVDLEPRGARSSRSVGYPPLNLTAIFKKLEDGVYRGKAHVFEDVRTMFDETMRNYDSSVR
uniref:Zn(2)-C6 fungal-type domain-containing protein n=1 Tax=Lotharella globosa TaxID=91324 RepID=A0A6V3JJJ0_9EUKA